MNLTEEQFHNLAHDSEALYKIFRIERRAAWNRFKSFDEKIKDYEYRHKMKRGLNETHS